MHISNSSDRLDKAWGIIDDYHNSEIIKRTRGKTLLDLGSGFGSLVEASRLKGLDAVGIEPDHDSLLAAKERFPKSNFLSLKGEEVATLNRKFDNIVFRDSLHHLLFEGDFKKALSASVDSLADRGRIIVFEPNLNFILRLARRLVKHEDFFCSLDDAKRIFREQGLSLTHLSFYEIIGIAGTGGYVGPSLIAKRGFVARCYGGLNHILSRIFSAVGLGKFICWRYVLVFEKLNSRPG